MIAWAFCQQTAPSPLPCQLLQLATIFDVGRAVELAEVFATEMRMAVIYDGSRNLSHQFVGIDAGVEQRVHDQHEQNKDQNTSVFKGVGQFFEPDF